MSEKNQVKEFFKLGAVGDYFLNIFKKHDPNKPTNFNLRMMHGINKISIFVFRYYLLCFYFGSFVFTLAFTYESFFSFFFFVFP